MIDYNKNEFSSNDNDDICFDWGGGRSSAESIHDPADIYYVDQWEKMMAATDDEKTPWDEDEEMSRNDDGEKAPWDKDAEELEAKEAETLWQSFFDSEEYSTALKEADEAFNSDPLEVAPLEDIHTKTGYSQGSSGSEAVLGSSSRADRKDRRVIPAENEDPAVMDRFLADVFGLSFCSYIELPHYAGRMARKRRLRSKIRKPRAAMMPFKFKISVYGDDEKPDVYTYPVSKISPKRAATKPVGRVIQSLSAMDGAWDSFLDVRLYRGLAVENGVSKGKLSPFTCFTLAVDIDSLPEIYDTDLQEKRLDIIYSRFPELKDVMAPTYIISTGRHGVQLLYCFRQDIMAPARINAFYDMQKALTKAFGGDDSYHGYGFIRLPGSARTVDKSDSLGEPAHILYRSRTGAMDWSAFFDAANHYLTKSGVINAPIRHINLGKEVAEDITAGNIVVNPYEMPCSGAAKDCVKALRAMCDRNGYYNATFYRRGSKILGYEGDPGDVEAYAERAKSLREPAARSKRGPGFDLENKTVRKLAQRQWADDRVKDLEDIAGDIKLDNGGKTIVVDAYAAIFINSMPKRKSASSRGLDKDSILKACSEFNSTYFDEPLKDETIGEIVEKRCVEFGPDWPYGHCKNYGDIELANKLRLSEDYVKGLRNRYTKEDKRMHKTELEMARREKKRAEEGRFKRPVGRPSKASLGTSAIIKAFYKCRKGSGSLTARMVGYMVEKLDIARSTAYRLLKGFRKLMEHIQGIIAKDRSNGTAGFDIKDVFSKTCGECGLHVKTLFYANITGMYKAAHRYYTGKFSEPGWYGSADYQEIDELLVHNGCPGNKLSPEDHRVAISYIDELHKKANDIKDWVHFWNFWEADGGGFSDAFGFLNADEVFI